MAAPSLSTRVQTDLRAPLLVLAAAFALLMWLNPGSYVGGGGDDVHYVTAARCWASAHACWPQTHWQTRWPVIAPIAASLELFGWSRFAVSVAPFLYSWCALLALFVAVRHWFGNAAALAAALALLATPTFSLRLTQPAADIPELAWLLLAVCLLQQALARGGRAWIVGAGLAFALAVQTRETALVAAPLLAFWVWRTARLHALAWAALGFALPLGAEAAFYSAHGQPALTRFVLALGHTAVPTTFLPGALQTGASPLFNAHLMTAWTPLTGLNVHWSVNGWLMLLSHPQTAFTFAAGAVMAIALSLGLPMAPTHKRVLLMLFGAGLSMAALLIYALAIHPAPRMFLPALASAATLLGVVWVRGARGSPALWSLAAAILMTANLWVHAASPQFQRIEQAAQALLAHVPTPVAASATAANSLIFLAPTTLAANAPSAAYVLDISSGTEGCAAVAPPGGQLLRSVTVAPAAAAVFAPQQPMLCLFAQRPQPLPKQASAS
jgi:hypothetical protein